uniref:Uncharacterized protein n=1 Tax=Mustela putorius furo TaxID=9669 RepID=M3Y3C2_MUSPF
MCYLFSSFSRLCPHGKLQGQQKTKAEARLPLDNCFRLLLPDSTSTQLGVTAVPHFQVPNPYSFCFLFHFFLPFFLSFFFFLKILFIYLTEREREITSRQSGRQRKRGKQAPC